MGRKLELDMVIQKKNLKIWNVAETLANRRKISFDLEFPIFISLKRKSDQVASIMQSSHSLCARFLFHVRSVILMVWLAQWPKIMLSLCRFSISCFDDRQQLYCGLGALAENMFKINLSMVAKFRRMEDTNQSWFNISFLESIISVWTELCREFKWFNFRIWTELNFERHPHSPIKNNLTQ